MKSFVRFATTLIATTLLFGCGGSDSSNTLDDLIKIEQNGRTRILIATSSSLGLYAEVNVELIPE
jgi:hypothetical protein